MKVIRARFLTFLICSLAVAVCAGCSGRRDDDAWERYAERLSPAVGEAKSDEFIKEWGAPHKKAPLDEGYTYNWHFSKGRRSLGFSYLLSVGSSHEAYDDVLLVFDEEDTLQEWRAECIR